MTDQFAKLLLDHREMGALELESNVLELVQLIQNGADGWEPFIQFYEYQQYLDGYGRFHAFETYRLCANLWLKLRDYALVQGFLRTKPKPMTTVELRQLIGSATGAWMGEEMQNKLAHHGICQMEQFMGLDRNYMWDIMKLTMSEMALIEGFQAKLESVS